MIFTRIRKSTKGLTLIEASLFVGIAICIMIAGFGYLRIKQNDLFTQAAVLADADLGNLVIEDARGAFGSSVEPNARVALVYHAPETAPDEAQNAKLLCVWSQGDQVHPMVIAERSTRWRHRYSPIEVDRDSTAYVPLIRLCDRVAT